MSDPFKQFRIPREIAQKKNVPIDDINSIKALKLEGEHKYVRDQFIAQYAIAGLAFADIFYLPPGDYEYIVFKRHHVRKDGYRPTLTTIVPDIAKEFLKNKASHQAYKNYLYSMRRANFLLKGICEITGVKPLTTHAARHTWNQTAKELGYSQEMRMEIMGQKVPGKEINQIYSGQFPQSVKDECVLHIASLLK